MASLARWASASACVRKAPACTVVMAGPLPASAALGFGQVTQRVGAGGLAGFTFRACWQPPLGCRRSRPLASAAATGCAARGGGSPRLPKRLAQAAWRSTCHAGRVGVPVLFFAPRQRPGQPPRRALVQPTGNFVTYTATARAASKPTITPESRMVLPPNRFFFGSFHHILWLGGTPSTARPLCKNLRRGCGRAPGGFLHGLIIHRRMPGIVVAVVRWPPVAQVEAVVVRVSPQRRRPSAFRGIWPVAA